MLPPRLSKEIEALGREYQLEIVEEPDMINVIVSGFPTGPLYNPSVAQVLIRVPRPYPDAVLDMFWTEVGLVLATGATPQCGDVIETYVGRQWRRFSWHPAGWQPSLQSLPAYLEFVRKRFRAA